IAAGRNIAVFRPSTIRYRFDLHVLRNFLAPALVLPAQRQPSTAALHPALDDFMNSKLKLQSLAPAEPMVVFYRVAVGGPRAVKSKEVGEALEPGNFASSQVNQLEDNEPLGELDPLN